MSDAVTLRECADEMGRLAENRDWEHSHFEADRLLVQAIRRLSVTPDEGVVKELLDNYEKVGKWYA